MPYFIHNFSVHNTHRCLYDCSKFVYWYILHIQYTIQYRMRYVVKRVMGSWYIHTAHAVHCNFLWLFWDRSLWLSHEVRVHCKNIRLWFNSFCNMQYAKSFQITQSDKLKLDQFWPRFYAFYGQFHIPQITLPTGHRIKYIH